MYEYRPPPRITRAAWRPATDIAKHPPPWGILIGGGFEIFGEPNLWNGFVLPYNWHLDAEEHGRTHWGALDALDGEGIVVARDWREDDPIWSIVFVSQELGCVTRSFQREEELWPSVLTPPEGQEHPCGEAPGGDDVDLEWKVFWYEHLSTALSVFPDANDALLIHVTTNLEDV